MPNESPPDQHRPASRPLRRQLAALNGALQGRRVCLISCTDRPPIVELEHASFHTTLPALGLQITNISYRSVRDLLEPDTAVAISGADIVVKLLHGHANREGAVHAALGCLGVTPAGHPPATDVLSQHKSIVKQLMRRRRIPTLPHVLTDDDCGLDQVEALLAQYGDGPYVLKPDTGNASAGLVHCPDQAALQTVISRAGQPCIVEPYLPGRVLTVAAFTLGRQSHALAPVEYLLGDHLVMDSAWKQNPRRELATGIDPTTLAQIQHDAVSLHESVGARGLSRSDFILAPDGSHVALEINTNTGLAAGHDLAFAFTANTLTYDDLLRVHLATGLRTIS